MQFIAPYSLVSAGDLALHLHPAHLADLRASGLTDDTIRAAGVYSLRPRDIAHFFNLRRGIPEEIETALCFPYQGAEFARVKLFPAVGKMKYAQPPGSPARLYMPFPVAAGPIVICEGEKKCLSAHQSGLNALGVGGLWSWLSHGEPIADLDAVEWDGRNVIVIPDSDVFQRADLLRAVFALGRELQSRDANVLVAEIPQASAGKVGLDDFLLAGGDVAGLEVFSLGHRIFTSCQVWHSRWKFQKATRAAA